MRYTKSVLIFTVATSAALGAAQLPINPDGVPDSYRAVTATGIRQTIAGPLGSIKMDEVAATSGVRLDDFLVVTPETGGVLVYRSSIGGYPVSAWPTETKVTSLILAEGSICWTQEKDRGVFVAKPGQAKAYRINVPQYAMRSLPKRLSPWAKGLLVHGDTDFAYLNLEERAAHAPHEVLPNDVLSTARQGIVTSSWDGKAGMLVSIRRYGVHQRVKTGVRDMGLMMAWSVNEMGCMQLLGGYTCSLVDFEDADGPRVSIKQGTKLIDQPYGTGSIGNIVVGREGVVGLGVGEAVVVPFYTNDWMPSRFGTAFRPNTAQNASYVGNNAWWADGRRAYRLDLTDGSGEAYVPKVAGEQSRSVIADEEGAWILTNHGIRRIEPEMPVTERNYSMVAAEATATAFSLEQTRIQDFVMRVSKGERMPDGTRPSIRAILKAAGQAKEEKQVDEAMLGDLVVTDGRQEIYLGNGEVLTTQAGTLGVRSFEPEADTRIYRVLTASPIPIPAPAPVVKPVPTHNPRPLDPTKFKAYPYRPTPPVPDYVPQRLPDITSIISRIMPIGINAPRPYLGTNCFLKPEPNSQFDKPYLPIHQQLLSVARSWVGVPYRWGGNTKNGVDCSGFVTAVFRELGVNLPRHSQDIAQVSKGIVVRDQLRFGDVLVYQRPRHVAIYIGNGQTMETVGGGVGYSSIRHRTQAIVRRFL